MAWGGGVQEGLLEEKVQEWKVGKGLNRRREVTSHYRRERQNGQKPGGEF